MIDDLLWNEDIFGLLTKRLENIILEKIFIQEMMIIFLLQTFCKIYCVCSVDLGEGHNLRFEGFWRILRIPTFETKIFEGF